MMQLDPPVLEGDKIHKFMSTIDGAFQNTIKRRHAYFCELSTLLITSTEKNNMIDKCGKRMPSHCATMKKILE